MAQDSAGPGRPRSDVARKAVLEAADDLLVEVGYAAMTMKGIAERAGVGRQTVYRWWATKAEILVEACLEDVREELVAAPMPTARSELVSYLDALGRFLTTSPAGLAYRALLGEAQHDPAVRDLVREADVVSTATGEVLRRVRPVAPAMPPPALASAQLVGPVLTRVLEVDDEFSPELLDAHAELLLKAWS
ncbi:TetR/AcrR family transcriptional regulator [Actinosynnema pretiosum]|uniref:TetR/AcrR family transcriptional regulator n=1 Tax=Actinosynnema pretiosum TaxID=42197 RepID=UPI001E621788|nr:TetR/AcrR family transcriptional regulator [Actinosynnema pretiosum]